MKFLAALFLIAPFLAQQVAASPAVGIANYFNQEFPFSDIVREVLHLSIHCFSHPSICYRLVVTLLTIFLLLFRASRTVLARLAISAVTTPTTTRTALPRTVRMARTVKTVRMAMLTTTMPTPTTTLVTLTPVMPTPAMLTLAVMLRPH